MIAIQGVSLLRTTPWTANQVLRSNEASWTRCSDESSTDLLVHATVTQGNDTQLQAGCVFMNTTTTWYNSASCWHRATPGHAPPYRWVLLADLRLRSIELRSPPRDTLHRNIHQHRPQDNAEPGGVDYVTSAALQALVPQRAFQTVPVYPTRSDVAWLVLGTPMVRPVHCQWS